MRKRFEQQQSMIYQPIGEFSIKQRSRDEMPSVLKALQYIFVTTEMNEKIFSIIEEKVCKNKDKNNGRPGMDLWHILVLSVVRHARNCDWDMMEYLANNDYSMRSIMGIESSGFAAERKTLAYQNIVDNVSLIDAETIKSINHIVAEIGIELIKKKKMKHWN